MLSDPHWYASRKVPDLDDALSILLPEVGWQRIEPGTLRLTVERFEAVTVKVDKTRSGKNAVAWLPIDGGTQIPLVRESRICGPIESVLAIRFVPLEE